MDESTTLLDMLSQQAVLEIVRQIHQERGLSTIIITHDMGVVAEMADRVVVLYAGRVLEEGPTHDLRQSSQHSYTQALIHAIPRITGDLAGRCPVRLAICDTVDPVENIAHGDGLVACHGVNNHD